MTNSANAHWFESIETVITEPLKFKAKLNIGEDAYTSLRLKNKVFEAWDVAGVAATAAGIAKTSTVASTFFAPSGFLAALGIGTAVTPIGWVIAASVISGGAWLGITRYIKNASNNKVTVIPNFINTPMDVLALGLFDLIAPLSLKFAAIDGGIDDSERDVIYTYFVNQWGYDSIFVREGLRYTENSLSDYSIEEVAQTLAIFKKENPDCNYGPMSKEIVNFLTSIMEADGKIDNEKEAALTTVKGIFKETERSQFTKVAKGLFEDMSKNTKEVLTDGLLEVLKKK